jgi:ankyrin repeat protein
MKIKKHLYNVFFLMLLGGIGFISAMDYPGMEQGELRPVDRVFLNAVKNNKNITLALNHGANINAIDPENGYSALHYAAMNGNISLITFLFSKGLIDFPAADGDEAFDVARTSGHPQAAQYILDTRLIGLAYFGALGKSSEERLQFFFEKAAHLLKKGANVNAVKRSNDHFDGFTPLLFACMKFDIEKVKFWIEKGADVNQASTSNMTPLYAIFAIKNDRLGALDRYAIEQLLLDNGADVTIKGPENHNVLQVAILTGSIESIKLLLGVMKNKMDLNVPDNVGHNAFSDAVTWNRIDLLPLLFDAGSLPISDKEGISPLHDAAINNYAEIVKWLLNKGVDVNVVDKNGQTPLHYAAEEASSEIVKALLDAGADPRIKDNSGKTAAQLSHKNKNKAVKALLKNAEKKPVVIPKPIQTQPIIAPVKKEEEKIKIISASAKKTGGRKKRKKKPAQEAAASVLAVETQTTVTQSSVNQPVVAESSVGAPVVEPTPVVQTTPSVGKPQKSKPSLSGYVERTTQAASDYVQKKVEAVLAPTKATIVSGARSYAGAVDPNREENKQQDPVKEITVFDDNMIITAPVLPSQQLMLTASSKDNPLIHLRYSEHVEKKKNNRKDDAHNFSSQVEERLGYLAQSKIIKQGKKDHPPVMQYTIPASISTFGGPRIFGAFEFMSQGNIMTHRMFKADKKIKKQKVDKKDLPLLMPPQSGGDGKELR